MNSDNLLFKRLRGIFIIGTFIFAIVLFTRLFPGYSVPDIPSGSLNKIKSYREKSDVPILKYNGVVRAGETLGSILSGEKIAPEDRYGIISEVKKIFDVKRIKAGNRYSILYDERGLKSVKYAVDYRTSLLIKRHSPIFSVELVKIPVRRELSILNGVIRESLFTTILQMGEHGELADLLATLYEYDVDFNRDIREGDSFKILILKRYVNGNFAGYGPLIAAELINRGNVIKLIRFDTGKGKYSYFHPDGRAVKKMFLRCPLPFMRVTSGFGFRRHPILGFSAKHNGVDFGAPIGTIVRASADGSVLKVSYSKIRGRYIVISHRNSYKTHYYHLSGIKKGIRKGRRVSQGEIIGYVGTTGRSTGPHLHYGIQRGRRFINPLRLKSPSKKSVPGKMMERFKLYERTVFALMEDESGNFLAEILLKGIVRLTNNS